jgi:lipopolysaccharide/colanic/teichoic acid biosynthesis glycosyltransferase/glycosyltransferase involved in cell wall biosynthesis
VAPPIELRTPQQPHLALVVTSALSTFFFRGQIARLRQAGFRITFISNPGPQTAPAAAEGAEVIGIPMERDIAVFKDIRSLWRLWRTLRRIRPDITDVGTPKAGLLGGIAARLAGVPHRIYTLHGLRLETATGWKRRLLTLTERIACGSAQQVRCVSPSVRDRAIALGVSDPGKAGVIGAGSANGIDCERFSGAPEKVVAARAATDELRRTLGIPVGAPVIGFVGRFNRDKGITELNAAYRRLKQPFPELRLLLVGDFEDGDPVDPAIRTQLEGDANVRFAGIVADPAPYYRLMDVVALPTYREGFPIVTLEAQASGVPVVTTTATGAVDSVLDGITGRLVPPRDEAALAAALQELLANPQKGRHMGQAGADWVRTRFRQEVVWEALIADYNDILQRKGGAGRALLAKRIFDCVLGVLLLLLLFVPLLMIAIVVKLTSRGPVLYWSDRVGRNNAVFRMPKFRTMKTNTPEVATHLLPDPKTYLTTAGGFLRSTSLDELPQLYSILRGDLSFVGPRPALFNQDDLVALRTECGVHKLTPGLTGWAQVNGRDDLPISVKVAFDYKYMQTRSFLFDLKILALTAAKVVRRDGVAH